MNWLAKLGGRKFILAIISIGVGTAIEIYTTKGLSTAMAGLLGAMVAAFSVSNVVATSVYTKGMVDKKDNNPNDSGDLKNIKKSVDALSDTVVLLSNTATTTQQLIVEAVQRGQNYDQHNDPNR